MENSKKIEDLDGEIWKDIQNYEGLYKISNFGRVKSLDRVVTDKLNGHKHIKQRILKINTSNDTLPTIMLSKEGKVKVFSVRGILSRTFDCLKPPTLKDEVWKTIIGYENLYMVSNLGRIKRLSRLNNIDSTKAQQFLNDKIMTPSLDGTGRFGVSLIKNKNIKRFSIHRLVAINFIPNLENKECIHHIDNNPLNNKLDNLIWVTKKENSQFASQAGRLKQNRKTIKKDCKINILSSIYTDKDAKLKDEKWIFINEYNKEYQISNYGRLKSFKKRNPYGKLIKPNFSSRRSTNGKPLSYQLSINGQRKMFYVHRLVAIYFIENPHGKPQVNHLDGNRQNNHTLNLEWATPLENNLHALRTGLRTDFGEGHTNSKLNTQQVIKIRELYSNGLSCASIAKIYNMKRHSISGIVRRLYWKHI